MKTSTMPVLMMIIMSYYGIDNDDGGPSNILREEEKRRQWLRKPERLCRRRRPSSKLRGKSPKRSCCEIMRSCFEEKSKNIGRSKPKTALRHL